MKIAVLGGAGAMARITLHDLISNPDVKQILVGDLHLEAATAVLEKLDDERLEAAEIDVRDVDATARLLEGYDVVINSTQYYFNMQVMKAALQAGVHYIDLGGLFHMTRKQITLDDEFRAAGLLAVLGSGSTPGITNVMARYAADKLDSVDAIDIKIGATDLDPSSTFSTPYSLETIIDECAMSPYIYEDEQWIELPPFSGGEEVAFPPPVGAATAHYTLHSEVASFPLSFKSKGIRRATFRLALPADFVRTVKTVVDLNLADDTPREIRGVNVRPRDVLLDVLRPRGVPTDTMPNDCDCLRVEVSGTRNGRPVTITLESLVFPHQAWRASAGALDTGVPPSIMAQMIARGDIAERGVKSPEECIPPVPFFEELARRGMRVHAITRESLN
jgi:saccharopine dehydrogenase-like NADP-dependent oxidoreductase